MSFFDREMEAHEQKTSWGQRTESIITNTGSEEEREHDGGKTIVLRVRPWFCLWIVTLYEGGTSSLDPPLSPLCKEIDWAR